MKMRISGMGLVAIILFFSSQAFSAAITIDNFGFESGLAGWTVGVKAPGSSSTVYYVNGVDGSGTPQTYATVETAFDSYNPTELKYFLRLDSEGISKLTVFSTNAFKANKGDTLSGFAAFDVGVAYDEEGETLSDALSIYFKDASGILSNGFVIDATSGVGKNPWTKWTWTAPHDGAYTINYRLFSEETDSQHNNNALLDAVPIPSTLLIFGSGLIGLLGLRRRIAA